MTNPYRSPVATVQDVYVPVTDATYEPRIFSTDGRLGRLRYFVYSFIVQFVMAFLVGILAAVAIPLLAGRDGASALALPLMVAIYVPILIAMLVMAKRRLNDMNQSGWLSLLMLVPLVNLIMALLLLFWPGSAGSNNYGPRPVKNSMTLIFFGVVLPLLLVGLLAAFAVPVYQEYVARAQAAQVQFPQQP
ncbi:MAG: hypothetical protein K0S46_334 [Moraxellaceae bacterium]|jgi:uncharacterized membrane protein YhaH (DUF805 family)|nr:hypothetical protein [Moraxellaceae bacterium]